MADFHDVRFPLSVALESTGGPERKTEIVTLGSGFEQRNAVWRNGRRRYDAGSGLHSLDDIHAVIAFFEARMGRLHGFRFKDFADWKSCPPQQTIGVSDQSLGTGDGETCAYPLVKHYGSGEHIFTRTITKPVAASVRIALDGVERTAGWSVDGATGQITFDVAPAMGVAVTAGFAFDVPVRFDSDRLTINLADFAAGEIPNIPLVEIRL